MSDFTAAEFGSITWWAKESATYYHRKPGFADKVELASVIGRKASAWAAFQEKVDKGLPTGEVPAGLTAYEWQTVAFWALDKADLVRNRRDEASKQRLEFARAICRKALALSRGAA